MTSSTPVSLLISCEHGGNQIPEAYVHVFSEAGEVLQTHRGWDPGALMLARAMSSQLNAPLFYSETSRLLIELNRSVRHQQLFSEFSQQLPEDERQRLIQHYYLPWRQSVQQHIQQLISEQQFVLHLSIHSFSPIWQGQQRRTSIGLLYDPRRRAERMICERWKKKLQTALPHLRIHSNQPYRGIADGFTTFLRRQFPEAAADSHQCGQYAGIEVEVNQTLIAGTLPHDIQPLAETLAATLPHQLPTSLADDFPDEDVSDYGNDRGQTAEQDS